MSGIFVNKVKKNPCWSFSIDRGIYPYIYTNGTWHKTKFNMWVIRIHRTKIVQIPRHFCFQNSSGSVQRLTLAFSLDSFLISFLNLGLPTCRRRLMVKYSWLIFIQNWPLRRQNNILPTSAGDMYFFQVGSQNRVILRIHWLVKCILLLDWLTAFYFLIG